MKRSKIFLATTATILAAVGTFAFKTHKIGSTHVAYYTNVIGTNPSGHCTLTNGSGLLASSGGTGFLGYLTRNSTTKCATTHPLYSAE